MNEAREHTRAVYEEMHVAEADMRAKRELFLKVFGDECGSVVLDIICKEICGEGRGVFNESATQMARLAGRQEIAVILRSIMETATSERDAKLAGK